MDVNTTLEMRAETHGCFEDNAAMSQALKDTMRGCVGWGRLQPYQREALEVIQHKIARILTGECNLVDSWKDGAGYFTLAFTILQHTEGAVDMQTRKIKLANGEWEAL